MTNLKLLRIELTKGRNFSLLRCNFSKLSRKLASGAANEERSSGMRDAKFVFLRRRRKSIVQPSPLDTSFVLAGLGSHPYAHALRSGCPDATAKVGSFAAKVSTVTLLQMFLRTPVLFVEQPVRAEVLQDQELYHIHIKEHLQAALQSQTTTIEPFKNGRIGPSAKDATKIHKASAVDNLAFGHFRRDSLVAAFAPQLRFWTLPLKPKTPLQHHPAYGTCKIPAFALPVRVQPQASKRLLLAMILHGKPQVPAVVAILDHPVWSR